MSSSETSGGQNTGGGTAAGETGHETGKAPAAAPAPARAAAPEQRGTVGTWPLWEVFVRSRRGLSHTHAGSLHAPDAEMALHSARDLYTRRGEGISLWVVRAADITASSPDEKDPFFAPAADKVYRHPTFYTIPEGVRHL